MHRFSWLYHPCANRAARDGLRGSGQRKLRGPSAMLITSARGAATARKDVRETAASLVWRRPDPSASCAPRGQRSLIGFALELLKAQLP